MKMVREGGLEPLVSCENPANCRKYCRKCPKLDKALAEIIDGWDDLPDGLKQAVLAIIRSGRASK
jgi:hypothetical protein